MILKLLDIQIRHDLQPRIQMDMFTVADYAEAMKEGRIFPPLEVVHDGAQYWLWDGFHRKKAAEQAGLIEIDVNVTEGTLEDAQWLALGANKAHGLKRTNEDKQKAVERALDHPKAKSLSDRQIAEHCGVSNFMVSDYRRRICDSITDKTVVRNGTTYTMNTANIGKLSPSEKLTPQTLDLLRHTPISEDKRIIEVLSQIPQIQQKQFEMAQKIINGQISITTLLEPNSGLSQPMQVLLSHEAVEYYTPSKYIEAARQVMGSIDLDPASCEEAQKTIQATHFYTEQQNGLLQVWHGCVWLNPPYSKTDGKSNQDIWSQKLITEYNMGNVTEAILLTKNASGYNWFEELWDLFPACFVRQRLSFQKSDGSNDGQSKHGTVLFYLGKNLPEFVKVFSQFGRITTPETFQWLLQTTV